MAVVGSASDMISCVYVYMTLVDDYEVTCSKGQLTFAFAEDLQVSVRVYGTELYRTSVLSPRIFNPFLGTVWNTTNKRNCCLKRRKK